MTDDSVHLTVASDIISYTLETEVHRGRRNFIVRVEHPYWSGPFVSETKLKLRTKIRQFQRDGLLSYKNRILVSISLANYPTSP